MGFRRGFVWGTVLGAALIMLYTPLNGKDARSVFLGPFGWREVESFPDESWSPRPGVLPPSN